MTRVPVKGENMKKKSLAFVSLLMALMLYAGAAHGEATPLIYKVEDGNGHTLYLFGTIHIGEESMYPLSDAVEKAYKEADILAVEMDGLSLQQDMGKMMRYSMALMYTDDAVSAADHMNPETYAMGVEKLGYSEAMLQRMRPIAWLSLAQEQSYARIGQTAEWGVDMMLLKQAHQDGKIIHELEGVDAQVETMLSMPDEIVNFQLQQYLSYPEAADISMKILSAAWRQGNEEIFSLLLAQEEVGIPPELEQVYAEYADKLLHSRDNLFEQKAIEYLTGDQTVLFAVGAAHIVGEGALAERLANAGYTVTEIGR